MKCLNMILEIVHNLIIFEVFYDGDADEFYILRGPQCQGELRVLGGRGEGGSKPPQAKPHQPTCHLMSETLSYVNILYGLYSRDKNAFSSQKSKHCNLTERHFTTCNSGFLVNLRGQATGPYQ